MTLSCVNKGSVSLAVVIIFGAWLGWISPDAWKRQGCTLTHNAAWLSVDWTSTPIEKTLIKALANQAATRELRYLYPYTTYLKSDGSFSLSYEYASDFVSHFRYTNEQTYLLAWVGIPLLNNRNVGIQGWVDLSKEAERQEIVDFVAHLVHEAHFDGVHLNVETVPDNDPNYLLLLDEVRNTLGSNYILSIAATYWLPQSVNHLPIVDGYRWSGPYYRAVANRVDQIVTMTYDSLMPYPAFYRLWMREQVRGISTSLVDAEVELLIGISVSEETTTTHKPKVENLLNGLAGYCAVAKNNRQHGIDGIALYASWEATEQDWRNWDEWLTNTSSTTQ